MTRLLGYDVKNSDACLNCHSTAEHGKGKQFYDREADGVTCVACHGASAEWVEIHQRTDQSGWRNLDRRTKQDRYGMIDLWDPVRRAETCASCHIGNHSEARWSHTRCMPPAIRPCPASRRRRSATPSPATGSISARSCRSRAGKTAQAGAQPPKP